MRVVRTGGTIEVLSRLKSRAKSAFQPSIRPFPPPPPRRPAWNRRAFERLANTLCCEKASVVVHTRTSVRMCVCVYICMRTIYIYIVAVKTPSTYLASPLSDLSSTFAFVYI